MGGILRAAYGIVDQLLKDDDGNLTYRCNVRLVYVPGKPIITNVLMPSPAIGDKPIVEEGDKGFGMVAPPNVGDYVLVAHTADRGNEWFILARFYRYGVDPELPAPAFRLYDWKVVSKLGGKIHVNDSFNDDTDGIPTGHITVLGDRILIAGGEDFLDFGLSDDDDDWPAAAEKPATGEILIVHDSGTKIKIDSDGNIEIDTGSNDVTVNADGITVDGGAIDIDGTTITIDGTSVNINNGSKGVARVDDPITTQTTQLIGFAGFPITHSSHQGKISSGSNTVKAGD